MFVLDMEQAEPAAIKQHLETFGAATANKGRSPQGDPVKPPLWQPLQSGWMWPKIAGKPNRDLMRSQ